MYSSVLGYTSPCDLSTEVKVILLSPRENVPLREVSSGKFSISAYSEACTEVERKLLVDLCSAHNRMKVHPARESKDVVRSKFIHFSLLNL